MEDTMKAKLPVEIQVEYSHLPVEEANAPFRFDIDEKHIKAARGCQKDGSKCVVAQACKADRGIKAAYIGATKAYLVFKHYIARFRTPAVLRDALNNWDKTGNWGLPTGSYKLMPTAATSQTRVRESASQKNFQRKKRAGLVVDNPKRKINMRRVFENGLRSIAN
jgi:hypothetical protein